ncbi:MAG TPA: hypothetical protein ENK74_02650 [Nitratifractor sp.]|nr:hypothetical protein [Nitratifractor sp.]
MVTALQIALLLILIALIGIILGYLFGRLACKKREKSLYFEKSDYCEDSYSKSLNRDESVEDTNALYNSTVTTAAIEGKELSDVSAGTESVESVRSASEGEGVVSDAVNITPQAIAGDTNLGENDASANIAVEAEAETQESTKVETVSQSEGASSANNSFEEEGTSATETQTSGNTQEIDSAASAQQGVDSLEYSTEKEVVEGSVSSSTSDNKGSVANTTKESGAALTAKEESATTADTETISSTVVSVDEKSTTNGAPQSVADTNLQSSETETASIESGSENVALTDSEVSESKESSGSATAKEFGSDELNEADKPAVLDAPREHGKDNLCRVKGIGNIIEGKLNDLGVYHFDQIAAWSSKEVEWVDSHLAFSGRIVREDWIGQAKILAQGAETEFSKRVDKGEVSTSKKD